MGGGRVTYVGGFKYDVNICALVKVLDYKGLLPSPHNNANRAYFFNEKLMPRRTRQLLVPQEPYNKTCP